MSKSTLVDAVEKLGDSVAAAAELIDELRAERDEARAQRDAALADVAGLRWTITALEKELQEYAE